MIALLLLLGCAPWLPRYPGPLGPVGRLPEPEPVFQADDPPSDAVVARSDRRGGDEADPDKVVRAAQYYLQHKPVGFPDDCSGFVCAVYGRVGFALEGNAIGLWDRAQQAGATHRRKHPRVGDIAFFDDTYDRNGNGKVDDELTHVAIVLSVDEDGTILMAHGGSSHGRTTLVMNLEQPHTRRDEDGKELNDYLRIQRKSDAAGTKYLAGELWRGFATVSEADLDAWLGDPSS
jgi:surface antigen